MKRSRSMLRVDLAFTVAALAFGCASTGDDTPPTGGTGATGGTGQPSAGRSGTGGSGASGGTGGSSGSTGTGATGGSVSSGGTAGGATAGGAGRIGAGGMAGTTSSGGAAGAGAVSMGGSAGAGASSGAGGGTAGTGTAAGAGGVAAGGNGSGGRGGGMPGAGTGGMPAAGAGGMSGGGNGKSAGCGKAPTIQSGMYNNGQHISITAANMQRRYILNVPANYDNTHPYKLVIAYHELNGNDDEMYKNKYYHLLPLSNDTTIFVAPNGQKNGSSCGDASGCGWPNTNNSDLALADAIVAQIEENFCVDTNRIFATGWSYGGSMSYKTACERPLGGVANGFIRAIAVYSGSQLSGNCTPSKPVAYFASHGTHDSVLNYSNGVGLAQNFAKANSCTWATPTQVNSGQHVCTDEKGCADGYPVKFCSFNGDHTPDPDNGQSGNSWVYQDVWNFFNQF